MTLYELFQKEKEQYLPVFTNMRISFNKEKNSITYKDGHNNVLIVVYEPNCVDIKSVFSKHDMADKFECLNNLLNNAGSSKFYYDFSSSYNPYSTVWAACFCENEDTQNQGLFDVFMRTASIWIKQKNIQAVLGVKYDGYGWSCTPVSVARRTEKELRYGEELYDEAILYTQQYHTSLSAQEARERAKKLNEHSSQMQEEDDLYNHLIR